MASGNILILDDDPTLRERVSSLLRREGYSPEGIDQSQTFLEKIEAIPYEGAMISLDFKGSPALQLIRTIKDRKPELMILALSSSDKLEVALEAISSGATDCITKPISRENLIPILKKGIARNHSQKDILVPKPDVKKEQEFANIVAKSSLMHEIFQTILKIAEYKTTCLLLGESGTGKELIARAIHYNSSRADQPFITVNCGAIPETLLESELFGHTKGAFTGAIRTKKGLFEEATLGTLFLDEIGELPLLLQVKILRALQEEEIRRVGDVNSIKVDVRIVAATTKDLAKEVERGNFREDLYYRLHVLPIHLPPLRDRKEDIPLLINYFVQKGKKKLNTKVDGVDPKALKILIDHDWPGNVRELENTIERAMVLCLGDKIMSDNLPGNFGTTSGSSFGGGRANSNELSIKKMNKAMEEELILRALQRCQGNRTKAAKLLEISHRALLYKIKSYKLDQKLKQAD